MDVKLVHAHIDQSTERYLEILREVVAIPSVSTRREDVRRCADYLRGLLEETGMAVTTVETDGSPVVIGTLEAKRPGRKTILFYGHYDVQPPEPLELWESDPFRPEIRNGRMYGRGTADNKGQLLAHILAVDAYRKQYGDIPVNVKIILDGEEEIGSMHFPAAVEKNQELLRADLVLTADGGMEAGDIPTAIFGVRGLVNFDIELETASIDNHSGNKGGVIKNAAWELVRILQTMIDDEDRVLIEGFYDQVSEPTAHDLALVSRLQFFREELAEAFGVKAIHLDKEAYFRRLMFLPTLTINGLNSGHIGEGCKNIIPKKAVAKMEARLVDGQDADDIFEKIARHVKSVHPDAAVIKMDEPANPSRTATDDPLCNAVIRSTERYGGKDVIVMPVGGGSLPEFVWSKIMKIPSILTPYGNVDESNHAPNENLDIGLYFRGIHTTAQILNDLGELQTDAKGDCHG